MVSLIEVVKMLKQDFPDLNIYPLEYPLNSPSNAVVVDMSSNAEVKAGVFSLTVQIKVRDTHPSLTEAVSFRLREGLEAKTNFMIDKVQVVFVRSQNPVPLYMGKDTNGNYLYSNNFRFVINEGVKP